MASLKLLGKKREKLIAPEFEHDSKEESTQSSYPENPYKIKYSSFYAHDLIEGLFDVWHTRKESTTPKQKLGDEKFKVKRFFNLASKTSEKVKPIKKNLTIIMNMTKMKKNIYTTFLL
jgi:hypothetical protein